MQRFHQPGVKVLARSGSPSSVPKGMGKVVSWVYIFGVFFLRDTLIHKGPEFKDGRKKITQKLWAEVRKGQSEEVVKVCLTVFPPGQGKYHLFFFFFFKMMRKMERKAVSHR